MNVTFRPIDEWPEGGFDPRRQREASGFRSTWERTLEMLQYELSRLDADSVVISLALPASEIRRDGWPYRRARPEHPGVILEFQTPTGWMRYHCDLYADWHDNVHDVALTLQELRALNRRGSAQGRQYGGFLELEAPGSGENAARALIDSYGGLRAALRATHPDRGGDAEEFRRVQEAREVLGL